MTNAEFFDSHVPSRFQRALAKLVLENYKESSRFCYRNFAPPQAKDLSGVYRRAKIEENLSGLIVLFPKTATISINNYEKNTGFYNEITCGQVKITQSCTLDPDDAPRNANFRSTLAKTGQLSLFDEDSGIAQGSDGQYMYAILTHGVDVKSPKRSWPGFIRVQFPNESCTRYVDDGINLMTRFPELIAEYIPKPAIQPTRRQRLRRELGGA